MIYLAARILDLEFQAIDHLVGYSASPDARSSDIAALKLVAAASTSPIWIGVGVSPYYTLYQQSARMKWAVDDVRHTRKMKARYGRLGAKFRTLTHWNYFPKHRAFAMRGGLRWGAIKVGSRFIPYVGWALLAADLWSLGKWIGEKTSPW